MCWFECSDCGKKRTCADDAHILLECTAHAREHEEILAALKDHAGHLLLIEDPAERRMQMMRAALGGAVAPPASGPTVGGLAVEERAALVSRVVGAVVSIARRRGATEKSRKRREGGDMAPAARRRRQVEERLLRPASTAIPTTPCPAGTCLIDEGAVGRNGKQRVRRHAEWRREMDRRGALLASADGGTGRTASSMGAQSARPHRAVGDLPTADRVLMAADRAGVLMQNFRSDGRRPRGPRRVWVWVRGAALGREASVITAVGVSGRAGGEPAAGDGDVRTEAISVEGTCNDVVGLIGVARGLEMAIMAGGTDIIVNVGSPRLARLIWQVSAPSDETYPYLGLIWGMASQLGERGSAVVRIGRYPSRRVNNRTRKRERFMRDDAVVLTLQAQNRLGETDVVFF